MQYVNDDMDELFRRAAENYPLDTNSGDWSKVAAALQNAAPPPARKKNKGRFLWLFLLVPFLLIATQYYHNSNRGTGTGRATTGSLTTPSNTSGVSKNNSSVPEKTSVEGTEVGASSKKELVSADVAREGGTSVPDRLATGKVPGPKAYPKKTRDRFAATDPSFIADGETYVSGKTAAAPGPGGTYRDLSRQNFIALSHNDPFAFDPLVRDLLEKKIVTGALKQETAIRKEKRFYAGLMAAFDITSVKFQKVEHPGYDYGAIFGYQLNKKWGIEAGIFLDEKHYYSEGQYYKGSVYIPPNSWMTEVAGDCKMIEIPVSVRYNFSSSKKASWFSTLGLSSYVMKKEDYGYEYYYAGSGTSATHYKSYTNAAANLFSAVHLSGGYTHSLGKIGDLRLEPYLKIPLSGMGSGKMPLSSAGLHIGLTRKLF
jgi:hypothetical protein